MLIKSLLVLSIIIVAQVVFTLPISAGVDVRVNDPATDTGDSTTQSETALAVANGVLCAGFNDFGPNGLSGWARSTNLGATWTDLGGINQQGDPVIVHHQASDTFYYASLGTVSPQVNASTDQCQNWGTAVAVTTFGTATTTLADKPWIAVDNSGGANDGNLYICWTRFYNPGGGGTSELRAARSTDGGATWTNEQVIGAVGTSPFGCSIGVDSNGNVAAAWADRTNNNIVFSRSTNAGVSYSAPTTINSGALRTPGTDRVVACGTQNRTTLNGNIRQLAQAWLAIDTTGGANDGNLYVVFATDPAGATDNADVFYSRSTNNGASWSAMAQIGAGGGATDQFEPNVAVAGNGDVAIAWYDRRNDAANNLNIDVYTAFSSDGGANFGAIVRVTDQSFGVPPINPTFNPGQAQCYLGEYLAIAGAGGAFYYLWGDNRNTLVTTNFPGGRLDPDIYFDVIAGPSNVAPTVSVAAAAGNEGASIALSGSATDADGDFLTFSWSVVPNAGVDAGGTCSLTGGTTLSPSVRCSDDGTYTVTLTATGDVTGPVSANAVLTVANVSPKVTATTLSAVIDEGQSYVMSATFADPGWNDTYTGSIDWNFPGEGAEAIAPTISVSGPPQDQGTISGSRQYGDNGSFTVVATVGDDDGGSGSDSVTVTVKNVAPTAAIDPTGAIIINGTPAFLAHAGEALDLSANSTDPGSDDLVLTWDWDDGGAAPDVVEASLVNPPMADLTPSPSVQPRNVTNLQTHAFADACRYDIVFASTDDDLGFASDTAVVIIVGNEGETRSAGYWMHQFRGNGNIDFTTAELNCLLSVVDFVSTVFSEVRGAGTLAQAFDVLDISGNAPMSENLDRELLAALLNFVNGSVGWDQLIDTNVDGVGDTPFSAVIAAAEAVRTNPAATKDELKAQKNLLERINLGLATP